MCFQRNSSWKGPKGLTTWISREDSLVFPTLPPPSPCSPPEPWVPSTGLSWERFVGKQSFRKRPEDGGRALKVRTCGCDRYVRTAPLICKLCHFWLPCSGQGRGWGARTREKTDPTPHRNHPLRRPTEAFSSLALRTKPGLLLAAHVCPRKAEGAGEEREVPPSLGREASVWALTLSPSEGPLPPISCRTVLHVSRPERETSRRPVIVAIWFLLSNAAGRRDPGCVRGRGVPGPAGVIL